MKVFYVCRTGRHTSLLAASLHLRNIRDEEDTRKIFNISGYNEDRPDNIGKPYLAGIDGQNAEIYTMGVTDENELMIRAAGELMDLMGISRKEWQIVDTSGISSSWTSFGQLVKRIRLQALSKVFFYLGARKELPRLKNVVYHTRKGC